MNQFSPEGNFSLPKTEEKVLAFWKKRNVFEKSLANRRRGRRFVFYEGPPTANGKPGIHHVLARSFKDVILRYKTMRGFFAPRRGGWDTHGLPVELEVEKQLGLRSKKDIEKYGIAKFNQKCRESVWRYKDEWEKLTDRMGFWLDLKNPYITYETNYIETLWRIIGEIWKKNLLYKGHKVVPWCSRCGTALSSHEMAQGYKTVTDNAVTVKFKLKKGQKITKDFTTDNRTYVLSWTTTPWTLPGNVALAVGEKLQYMSVTVSELSEQVAGLKKGETYIFATTGDADQRILGVEARHPQGDDTVADIFVGGKKVGQFINIRNFKGKELVDLSYEPLFKIPALKNKASHKIYAADFVTTDEGTGVVHTAVMYGEDDYKLGVKVGLPQHHTVDEQGKFTKEVPGGLAGMYVKSKETEEKIFTYLKKNGNFLSTKEYAHDYPYCWRCDTPLLYYARTSWFVVMTKLKKQLLANNGKINWVPEHVKNGRFGEWLRDIKDWNFSRERYWGTPLPIWECKKCGSREVVGGIAELGEKMGGARNAYFVMRHGEAENNLTRIIDQGQGSYHLTLNGRVQVERAAKKLAKEKIDMIIASDIPRTKETAKLAASLLGIKKIMLDKRLREIKLPNFAGCHDAEYHKRYPTYESRFSDRPERGESLRDLRGRMWEFISDIERRYKGKRILLVSHEYPIWMLAYAAEGWSEKEAIAVRKGSKGETFINYAEARPLSLVPAPRNETGEVDLHRPYIDAIVFPCAKCKGKMARIKELADVWFDSGAMPFAQVHWPFFGNTRHATSDMRLEYPADYISEAVDQTRGWFYTLLAVGTLLGKPAPYKNVICLGHVNDKFGQKMSKSRGNIVDPWAMAEKYGMDAVRWYFYTATPPGEPKNFDENDVIKTYRRFHQILWNSFVFYNTYGSFNVGRGKLKPTASHAQHLTPNLLDRWILARLAETTSGVTRHLDRYAVREAGLTIEGFVDDLSRWYIRRSRRRFSAAAKGFDGQGERRDYEAASSTLGFVLRELAKLIAPFAPFFAETMYGSLRTPRTSNSEHFDSVHLAEWPIVRSRRSDVGSRKLLEGMVEVRRIASLALAKRAELGIKVRQPLTALTITNKSRISNPRIFAKKMIQDLLVILADEVNVKRIVFDSKIAGELEFDTVITPELKAEGILRELARAVQDLRQEAKLKPGDAIALLVRLPEGLRSIVAKHEKSLKKDIGARSVEYKKGKFHAEIETKIDEFPVWLGVRRVHPPKFS